MVAAGIHPLALVGDPPEHRDWSDGDRLFAPEIDASARLEAFVTVDAGLRTPTLIGARSWLMKHVHVGHDARIGAGCELAPHCSVGGHVQLGDGVRVGQGALFKPFVVVGDGARIGMGAVVIRDVPAGEVWVGNPARPLRRRQADELTELELEGWEQLAAAHERPPLLPPDHLEPITRCTPSNGVMTIGLDPREACYVLANGARLDGKRWRGSLDGCNGRVQGDGRVMVRLEQVTA